MDQQEEYHDPDYPEAPPTVKEEPATEFGDEKIEKIRSILHREFDSELQARENDIKLINQRSLLARRLLHRLRYTLVHKYYNDERLKLTAGQIQDEVASHSEPRTRTTITSLLRDGQRRLHPSIRKLLGKQSSAVELNEILFRKRAPRNNTRRDYCAMVQSRNYTIAADATKSLRPCLSPEPEPEPEPSTSRARKVPRKLLPKISNVVTLDEATRNQMKYRYRIIIGNTSKFAPPASAADRSTHKWLLYVRGPPARPSLRRLVRSVTVTLHHSYAPHHTVTIDKPPFHISRRGWGEFPAKVELHFALPERNRPATLEHTIKLDRNYTGFQTLGAETVVDVWLYSTEEMLEYEYKDEDEQAELTEATESQDSGENSIQPTETVIENNIFETDNNSTEKATENWLDFFTNATELDVDEMIIKPQKKVEEKNDLDTLIESSVISKETVENCIKKGIKQEIEDNHYDENSQEEYPSQLCEKNNSEVKKGPLEDIPNELLNQTASPKKRIMKYMDPATGKIYYLEMDRKLDLTKVQEIVINSKGNVKTAKISPIKSNGLKKVRKAKKGGVSLLKPEIKSLLKSETKVQTQCQSQNHQTTVLKKNFTHIENDHCYFGPAPVKDSLQIVEKLQNFEEVPIKEEQSVLKCICSALKRLCTVRMGVDYCLKKMPIITSECHDPDYVMSFPYVVASEKRYWKLDFAKRRNIEWTRAKLINRLLTEHLHTTEPIWRTKQILIYSRLHGYYPIRTDSVRTTSTNDTDWSSWVDMEKHNDSDIKEIFPNASDISTLTKFNPETFSQSLSESLESTESDDEIEVVGQTETVRVKKEIGGGCVDLPVLPVTDPQERLRFMFIERKCADIGIELRNEDVGCGYSYSAVHAVLLSAMRSFAEDMVRSAAAARRSQPSASEGSAPPVWRGSSSPCPVSLADVFRAAARARLAAASRRHLAATPHHATHL